MNFRRRQYDIIFQILVRRAPIFYKREKLQKTGKMIKDREELQRFEAEIIRKEKVDILKNFLLLDAMYKEAVSLGVFPMKDALMGLEVDLKIAKVINSVY